MDLCLVGLLWILDFSVLSVHKSTKAHRSTSSWIFDASQPGDHRNEGKTGTKVDALAFTEEHEEHEDEEAIATFRFKL